MKKIIINIAAVAMLLIILALLQALLKPKYMSSIHEGNLVEEYYKEKKLHDVIFIGDCEVFSNISPVALWEEYGITSYIRGSAQQLVWQSYYLLEDTLNYEKPKVVVFNVLAMKYNEPQKEAYNRLTLDGMKLSASKLRAIEASQTKGEALITYLFPLLRYHSRWNELTGEDLKYLFHKDTLSHNGYLMRVDSKPVDLVPKGKKLSDYRFGDNAYAYLDRITKLCQEKKIKLILIKSPSVYPYWYEEWDRQMSEYAKVNDLTYINFLEDVEKMGIDYNTDTFDGGLHLNLNGAEKFTGYFGKILSKEFSVADHRGDKKYTVLWDKKVAFYEAMRKEQEGELKEYGYLKSCGVVAQVADQE